MWCGLQLLSFMFMLLGVLLCSGTRWSTESSPTPSPSGNNTTSSAPSWLLSSGKKNLTSFTLGDRCNTWDCICFRKDHVNCEATRHGLRVIPKVPSNTRYFRMWRANLQTVSRHTLSNLSYVPLVNLGLDFNNITHITADAFQDLVNLTSITLRGNRIPASTLRACFFSIVSPSLSTLALDNMNLAATPDDLFDGLAGKRVRMLSLDSNHITAFNNAAFAKFAKVTTLRLRDNQISELSLSSRAHVDKIVLSRNLLTEIPDCCLKRAENETSGKPTKAFEHLVSLDLGENQFQHLSKKRLSRDCLPDLEKLYIRSCPGLRVLENNLISDLPKIRYLAVANLTSLRRYEPLAFNSSTLMKLLLMRNRGINYRSVQISEIFRRLPKLKSLSILDMKMNIRVKDVGMMLKGLHSLVELRLHNVDLGKLPTDLLWRFSKLETLIFEGNVLNAANLEHALSNVTNIRLLNIQGNRLTTITKTTFSKAFLQNVKEIDLRGNRFACTCELLWFRNWLDEIKRHGRIKITEYPSSHYSCFYPVNLRATRLHDFHPSEDDCDPTRRYIRRAIVGGVLGPVALVVTALLAYRYRLHIGHYLYRIRRRHPYVQVPLGEATQPFKYDIYLAHSVRDMDWIAVELLPLLEEEQGMKVFVETRDGALGVMAENIARAIEESERVVLLISDNYNQEDWRQYEFRQIIFASVEEQKDVIVLLLGDVEAGRMVKDMRRRLIKGTFLQWGPSEEARRMFRADLKLALKTRDVNMQCAC